MKNKLNIIAELAEMIGNLRESCFQDTELEHIAGTISIIAKQAIRQYEFEEERIIKKSKESQK